MIKGTTTKNNKDIAFPIHLSFISLLCESFVKLAIINYFPNISLIKEVVLSTILEVSSLIVDV